MHARMHVCAYVRVHVCECVGGWVGGCVSVCVDGMNLKYELCWHIHVSVYSILTMPVYTIKQAHMHPQTI